MPDTSIPIDSLRPLCRWSQSLARKDCEAAAKERKAELNILPTWQYFTTDHREKQAALEQTDSDRRLKNLYAVLETLDERGFRRSSSQRMFHQAFVCACLKKIYGEDLDANLVRLMREYNLDDLNTDVIVCTPRRFGKTTGAALYAFAYAATQPNAEISIYSTGRRASKKFLALCYKIAKAYFGDDKFLIAYNQEELHIRGPGTEPGIIRSFPSKVTIGDPLSRSPSPTQ